MDSNHRPHAYQACALTSWAISPYGGDKEIRTLDPLRARQVLSQLSYTPICFIAFSDLIYFIRNLFLCQHIFRIFLLPDITRKFQRIDLSKLNRGKTSLKQAFQILIWYVRLLLGTRSFLLKTIFVSLEV